MTVGGERIRMEAKEVEDKEGGGVRWEGAGEDRGEGVGGRGRESRKRGAHP